VRHHAEHRRAAPGLRHRSRPNRRAARQHHLRHLLDCAARHEIAELRPAFEAEGKAPRCRRCRGFVKTATVSFGQSLPQAVVARGREETLAADLFVAVGSSLVVYPAAGFPELAQRNGAALAILNRDATRLDPLADVVVNRSIGEALGIVVGVA
jgi:NAD-dependent deacetylase